MFERESRLSIKAINKELERLHYKLKFLDIFDDSQEYEKVFGMIEKLNNTLIEIARRYNGLEY